MKLAWYCRFSTFMLIIILAGCGIQDKYSQEKNRKETAEMSLTEENLAAESDPMEPYYGVYEIVRFLPSYSWSKGIRDSMPAQEADMMLGKIIMLEPDYFQTYDPGRVRGEQNMYRNEYVVQKYIINNPCYVTENIISIQDYDGKFDFELFIDGLNFELNKDNGKSFVNRISLSNNLNFQYFYTLDKRDEVIMQTKNSYSNFLLIRLDEYQELPKAAELTESEKHKILDKMYGTYEVVEFLPTKYYPSQDSDGYKRLPLKEAESMIGKKIVITKEEFFGYDMERETKFVDEEKEIMVYRINGVSIEEPGYGVNRVRREDIYGLRDNMLPKELIQTDYIEIKTKKGYENLFETFIKLYQLENQKIIMLCMNEYFLIEKVK